MRANKPKHLVQGLTQGVESIATGVFKGISG